jgi:hypothetical protein
MSRTTALNQEPQVYAETQYVVTTLARLITSEDGAQMPESRSMQDPVYGFPRTLLTGSP